MQKYILAVDQGTTSSRAIIFDRAGSIIARAQYPVTQHYPHPGWVEHDPDEILSTQLRAMDEAFEKSGLSPASIAAIGVTNQRETTILWDRSTGRPVCNAIVWQCRRTAQLCQQLQSSGLADRIRKTTGLVIDPYFSATKIRWLLDSIPGLRGRAERGELAFGNVDSWLIWNLTGGRVHITDYSNASRTMLFDIDRLQWDEELCRLLDIPPSLLPQPVESSRIYGTLAPNLGGLHELAGTPVAGAAGDQAAALFGQACFAPQMAKSTYGTGCFTLMNLGSSSVRSENGLVTSVAWSLGGKTTYALEGSAFHAGSAIQWLRDECGVVRTAHETDLLAETAPDNGGVYFVPAFTGLGAPWWDPSARGSFFGLTRSADRAVLCRAVLESIAFEADALVRTMNADAGSPITQLRVDGGASVSDFMMQFQADLLNICVNRPQNVETTALGAAYLAGLATGVWSDLHELETCRLVDRIFSPQMDETQRQTLRDNWSLAVSLSRQWGQGVR